MKKYITVILLFLVIISLTAQLNLEHSVEPVDNLQLPFKISSERNVSLSRNPYPAPNIEFIPNINGDNVISVMTSYYDYSPFSFNGHAIQQQPVISEPNGYPADGKFISIMGALDEEASRYVYYSYLNNSGEFIENSRVNANSESREGYPSFAVDNLTGDIIATWHSLSETDELYKSFFNSNPYHLFGTNENWVSQHQVIEDSSFDNEEYIFPQVRIGPSPLDGHRRVHFYASYFSLNSNNHNAHPVYAYADFTTEQLESECILDWNYHNIPFLSQNPHKACKEMIVSNDGKIAFIGTIDHELFVYKSENYGDSFMLYTQNAIQEIDNPFDPSMQIYLYPSTDSQHFNGTFTNDNNRIVWMGAITLNTSENMANGTYYSSLFYPKIFSFDLNDHSFHFYDIDIQDEEPADHLFANPIVYDENGVPYNTLSYPSWYYEGQSQESYLYHSRFQVSSNNNWVVAAWHDNRKHVMAYIEEEGYESWLQQPEVAYCVSVDGGITWSDITYMNANPEDVIIDEVENLDGNYYPEFADKTITNISLAKKIEVINNTPENYHAAVDIAFYKDNSYGSYHGITGAGENLGGTVCYAKLDIEFPDAWNGEMAGGVNEEIESIKCKLENFPNPFNPSTEIRFQMSDLKKQKSVDGDQKVDLEIFNVKGQKIKSFLLNPSTISPIISITWNGTDSSNNPVSSGVYFYTLKQKNRVLASNKMLLMK